MVMSKETIARGASPKCIDCGDTPSLDIYRSHAGYYIGTFCQCGPYSRESDYYETRELAEAALKAGGFER
jgi:hypothetical protein